MTPLGRVVGELHDDVSVGRLEGEIDASNVAAVGGQLRALLSNQSHALVVDLTATTYLDSAGINLLFALREELRGRQQRLHLVLARASPIARMLAITGLDRLIPTHTSLDDAVATARGRAD